jgi:hypothetical protein
VINSPVFVFGSGPFIDPVVTDRRPYVQSPRYLQLPRQPREWR